MVKQSFNELPPRMEYILTGLGKKLAEVLWQLNEWGKLLIPANKEVYILLIPTGRNIYKIPLHFIPINKPYLDYPYFFESFQNISPCYPLDNFS